MKTTIQNHAQPPSFPPAVWKWCGHCESAFDLEKASWHLLEASIVSCPICGAGAEGWRDWAKFQEKHPLYPEIPTDGGFYPRTPVDPSQQ